MTQGVVLNAIRRWTFGWRSCPIPTKSLGNSFKFNMPDYKLLEMVKWYGFLKKLHKNYECVWYCGNCFDYGLKKIIL